ncbi:MerR family transcriptional regulator [Streptomyces lincolnensis]|uniref:MerR family transcriptional regulator n=1 Tax=Streptomyces lincolnensis TaxID=1915 RepID=UPI001E337977|nr:MerR family transcriptional regulator [Streptomyces lincolnensis]MCD7445590.1 MerR family transcriptional regulator [Streptomyces lincolnensis]
MDDGDTLCSIGELARRTGLTVKTVRLYSDRGIVTPAERTGAGYRRYGPDAVARLAFVRTLRELGLGLDAIRQVVDRELTLGEVAARHAAALEAQIRILRLRRSVLTAVARRGPTPEETRRMHDLARLSAAERAHLVDDFLDAVLDDVPGSDAIRRSMTPDLPDSPTEEQIEAWVELAELTLDPEFRTGVRRMAASYAEHLEPALPVPPRPDVVALVRDRAQDAVASGVPPRSRAADPVVAALTAECARALGRPDDAGLRRQLVRRLEAANAPHTDRYFRLLAVIHGWPPPWRRAPVLDWTVTALRARIAG